MMGLIMGNVNPLDVSSEFLTGPQVRDFSNRVLMGVADRVSGGSWERVTLNLRLLTDGVLCDFDFIATCDGLEDDLGDEEVLGSIAVDYDYRFVIPFFGGEPEVAKAFGFRLVNQDKIDVDNRIGYNVSAYTAVTETPRLVEVEHLVQYGELMLDTATFEQDLSGVTVADLDLITAAFKKAGLVRSICMPLSKRVRPQDLPNN